MAGEEAERGGRWGPFELGARFDEVEPGLGALHAAWHVRTGEAALVLLPGEGVEWQFQGCWDLRLRVQPEPPSLSLQVERAPASALMAEMADMLVLMTAAIQRVEDSPRVQTLLQEEPVPPAEPGHPRAGWMGRSWRTGAAVGGAVLLLGLGVWLYRVGPRVSSGPSEGSLASGVSDSVDAPHGNSRRFEAAPIAYPLPDKPFRNQETAPCGRGEVEINRGCWVELAAKPPCLDIHAEHRGKCYLAILKSERPPQAAHP